MKAIRRIDKQYQKRLHDAAKQEMKSFVDREQAAITRRAIKLMIVTLHNEFGFGKERLSRLLAKITELTHEKEDVRFYIQVDKIVCDELGFDIERENYDDWE